MSYSAESQPEGELSLQITRADGTIVPIGPVARTGSPLRRAWFNLIVKPRTERRIRKANRDAQRRSAN